MNATPFGLRSLKYFVTGWLRKLSEFFQISTNFSPPPIICIPLFSIIPNGNRSRSNEHSNGLSRHSLWPDICCAFWDIFKEMYKIYFRNYLSRTLSWFLIGLFINCFASSGLNTVKKYLLSFVYQLFIDDSYVKNTLNIFLSLTFCKSLM